MRPSFVADIAYLDHSRRAHKRPPTDILQLASDDQLQVRMRTRTVINLPFRAGPIVQVVSLQRCLQRSLVQSESKLKIILLGEFKVNAYQ